jgi:hypothetical protein
MPCGASCLRIIAKNVMKLQHKITFLFLFLCGVLYGKPTSYKMEITQNSLNNFWVKLDILLQKNYCKQDTLEFFFGGLIPDISVDSIIIKSKKTIPFAFDQENKLLKISKKDIKQNKITFEYSFNIIWGVSRDTVATLFYNSLEYPIPFIKDNDSVSFNCKIKKTDSFSIKTNIQKIDNLYKSNLININDIAFLFLDTALFKIHHFSTPFCEINIFTTDSIITENDYSRLKRKLKNCIDYFSTNIVPCRYKELNIIEAEWWGSTFLGNFAVVNKSDFMSYILFHEIIHEWIGGIITTKKDSKGEFLLRESLNDYLTLQFLKYEEGDSLYNVAIQNYKNSYNDYLRENNDISIWNITKYTNSTHAIIMYKQVLLLDEFAQKIGYEKFNNFIFKFLKSVIGKSIEASDFLNILKEKYGQEAIDYCEKI